MGKAYSDDLRCRVVAGMAAGRSCRDVGAVFGVAPSTAGNWWRRYRRENSHAARSTGGDRRSKLLEQADWIAERLAETPELTLVRSGKTWPGAASRSVTRASGERCASWSCGTKKDHLRH